MTVGKMFLYKTFYFACAYAIKYFKTQRIREAYNCLQVGKGTCFLS